MPNLIERADRNRRTVERFTESFLKAAPNYRFPEEGQTRYGYPLIAAKDAGWDDYLKQNPHVAGMAAGQGLNGDTGKERYIVVNPYNSYMMDPEKREGLYRIEAVRHMMAEDKFKPNFEITPKMQEWRKNKFKNGEGYATDDDNFKETIISRALVGDDTPEMSPEAQRWVDHYNQKLNTRSGGKPRRSILDR